MLKIIYIIYFFIFTLSFSSIKLNQIEGNKGKRYAICIGINEYEDDSFLDLSNARNDAKGLSESLKKYGQFDFIYTLTDDISPRDKMYPSKRKIENIISYLKEYIKPEDLLVFSFSGHGVSDNNGNSYLIVSDSYSDDIYNTSINLKKNIIEELGKSGIKKTLFLIDACREKLQKNKGINNNSLKSERFKNSEIAAVFYATKDGWYSYEMNEGYGAFSQYLISGISGDADKSYYGNKDGIVSFSELQFYVEEKVEKWALENMKKQRPYTKIYGETYGNLGISTYIEDRDKKNEIKEKRNENEENIGLDYIPKMISINGGNFLMGDNLGKQDQIPAHRINLKSFYISKYEITVKEFKKFVEETSYITEAEKGKGAWIKYIKKWKKLENANWKNPYFRQNENEPVVCISYFDATQFCNWLSKKLNIPKAYDKNGNLIDRFGRKTNNTKNVLGFRLPTEAEWEYAASSGKSYSTFEYSGDNKADNVAWYDKNSNNKTHSVGVKLPNEKGIYDMSGNAWEWCQDIYSPNYYKESPFDNPLNFKSGYLRIMRGGSWADEEDHLSLKSRNFGRDEYIGSDVGFRIVKTKR